MVFQRMLFLLDLFNCIEQLILPSKQAFNALYSVSSIGAERTHSAATARENMYGYSSITFIRDQWMEKYHWLVGITVGLGRTASGPYDIPLHMLTYPKHVDG